MVTVFFLTIILNHSYNNSMNSTFKTNRTNTATTFVNKGFRFYYRFLMYVSIFIAISLFVAAMYLYSLNTRDEHTQRKRELGPLFIIGTLYFAFMAWVYRYISVTKYAGIGFALFTLWLWITSSPMIAI